MIHPIVVIIWTVITFFIAYQMGHEQGKVDEHEKWMELREDYVPSDIIDST